MQSADVNVDAAEIAKFSALAQSWWDPAGPSKPLHDLNPLRLQYVEPRRAPRRRLRARRGLRRRNFIRSDGAPRRASARHRFVASGLGCGRAACARSQGERRVSGQQVPKAWRSSSRPPTIW